MILSAQSDTFCVRPSCVTSPSFVNAVSMDLFRFYHITVSLHRMFFVAVFPQAKIFFASTSPMPRKFLPESKAVQTKYRIPISLSVNERGRYYMTTAQMLAIYNFWLILFGTFIDFPICVVLRNMIQNRFFMGFLKWYQSMFIRTKFFFRMFPYHPSGSIFDFLVALWSWDGNMNLEIFEGVKFWRLYTKCEPSSYYSRRYGWNVHFFNKLVASTRHGKTFLISDTAERGYTLIELVVADYSWSKVGHGDTALLDSWFHSFRLWCCKV